MNRNHWGYFLAITLYLGVLAIITLVTFLAITMYLSQKDPTYYHIATIFFIVLLLFFHALLIWFNFDAWQAKQSLKAQKSVIKQQKLIDEHPPLLTDLIKNKFKFGDLDDKHKSLLKSLDLEKYIQDGEKEWIEMIRKMSEQKTSESLINSIKDDTLRKEFQDLLLLKEKVKAYDSIFEKLQTSISEMLKCNGLSLDLHNVRDKAGVITLDNLTNVNEALNRVTEEYTLTTKTLNSSLNDVQKAQATISASAKELISNTDHLKNDCKELKDQIEKIKEDISAKEKKIKAQQTELNKNAKNIQDLNATLGKMSVKKASTLDKLKSWFKK